LGDKLFSLFSRAAPNQWSNKTDDRQFCYTKSSNKKAALGRFFVSIKPIS
jgi:hypothetical protein